MKLHSFAFYALVAPVITLGAGSVLADRSADQDFDREQQRNTQGATQSHMKNQAQMQNRGYMASIPAKSMQGSNLIGAEVKTMGGDEVGPVEDLIIGQDGQITAIVVGVGGFLGLGERKVAIGWDDVTKSVAADADDLDLWDDMELRINATRESLSAAPEFEAQE